MEISVILIMIALMQYIYFVGKVGATRVKFKVKAPAMSGDDIFERTLRVQQNTFEQLIIFVPSMFTFAMYVSSLWVLLPGITFIIGRQIYAMTYVKDPATRAPGFILTFFSNIALVVGTLIGVGIKLFS